MGPTPETRYAKSGGVHLAYQVIGTGQLNLVFLPEWLSHIEVQWEEPAIARFLMRVASFSRLILFNRRGTGMSDPVAPTALPTVEEWMEDVGLVMDAAGAERAALWGLAGGGPVAALFAATFPARTSALVLTNTFARLAWAPDHPIGTPPDVVDRIVAEIESTWGTGASSLLHVAPSVAEDDRTRAWMSRYERLAASPGAATAIVRMTFGLDVRPILGSIRTPTLVLHRTGARFAGVEHGRDLARRIPQARFVELPGDDLLYWAGDHELLLEEVEEFLTGVRSVPADERFLATLLFVDIVESTQHVAAIGDRRWRDLLDIHYAATRTLLARYGGRIVDTAGDGLLATFDGPARGIRCACAMVRQARAMGMEVRAGLHTGEVQPRNGGIAGVAVHVAARVADVAGPGQVYVSRTVVDLVAGSGIVFTDLGEHELRGVSKGWQLFGVNVELTQ